MLSDWAAVYRTLTNCVVTIRSNRPKSQYICYCRLCCYSRPHSSVGRWHILPPWFIFYSFCQPNLGRKCYLQCRTPLTYYRLRLSSVWPINLQYHSLHSIAATGWRMCSLYVNVKWWRMSLSAQFKRSKKQKVEFYSSQSWVVSKKVRVSVIRPTE